MLKGVGMLVIFNFFFNDGRYLDFFDFILNFCSNLVKNRKSFILVSEFFKYNFCFVKVKKNKNIIRWYFKILKFVDIIDMC